MGKKDLGLDKEKYGLEDYSSYQNKDKWYPMKHLRSDAERLDEEAAEDAKLDEKLRK
jgi:hypothetical protein